MVTPASSDQRVLPVTLANAIRHLRALAEDADTVEFCLRSAVERVEDYTGRVLVNRSFLYQTREWPTLRVTELRRSPLVSVQEIAYYPADGGALVVVAGESYRVLTAPTPGHVEFVDTFDFPALASREDAVRVSFTAGYGTTEQSVPPLLRNAVLLLARHFFDNRSVLGDGKDMELPFSVRDILRAYRV